MFTNYFGLSANPFSLTADFSFFKIDAPKHAICQNLIRDLTNGCCRFIVTGASGVGKSQLLRYLFTRLPSETQTIFLSGNSLNYSDRIRFIIELTTENALLGKKSLVVIDNVHEIPEEDLRLLFSLVSQNKQTLPALPIIFCGLPNLEKRLEPLGFKQIIGDHCSRYHVSEIDELQVRDYINFRLKQAGYESAGEKELFSAQVIKLITALSQGIPHTINLICGASLLIACLDDKRIVNEQIVYEAAMSCLLSSHNSHGMLECESFINLPKSSEKLPEQNAPKEISYKQENTRPLPSFMALPAVLLGVLRALNKSRLKSLPGAFNRKPFDSANQPALQKRFEKEILSGTGIGFLVFSCLLLFNWLDNSRIISSPPEMLAESSQPLSEKKNLFVSLAFAEINNKTVKTIKKTGGNAFNGWADKSVKRAIAKDKDDVLLKSSPISLVSYGAEKVNFYQTSAQYPASTDQQKAVFVSINHQKPEHRPEKLKRIPLIKPNLSFRVSPKRISKSVAIGPIITNKNSAGNPVLAEMELSARERSSSRRKLDKLGIDYSVEALLSASRQGNVQALKLMLAAGIPPDIKDAARGESPLLEGVKNGQLQVVQTLLEKGAYADIRNNEGQTALITAVKNGKNTIVKALLKGGSNPNVSDLTGRTALSYAKQTNNTEIMSLLAGN